MFTFVITGKSQKLHAQSRYLIVHSGGCTFHHQNAGQNNNIQTCVVNKSFEKFIYLSTTLNKQNCMNEEVKSKFNSGMPRYQRLLSSHLLSKHTKIKIYRTIILPCLVQTQNLVSHFPQEQSLRASQQKDAEEDIRTKRKEVTFCFMIITKYYSCD